MTKAQEFIRDLTNDIDALRAKKNKIKQLALEHRSSLPNEQYEKFNAEADKREKELDAEITKKQDELIRAQNLKEEKTSKMNIATEKTVTREQEAWNAGIGAAKVIIAHRTNGKVVHKLSDDEVGALLRSGNTLDGIYKFTGGKMNLRASNPDFAQYTTTSEEFVAATATTLGINNGGIFLNTEVLYDLLRIRPRLSAFAQRVRRESIPGKIEFPYHKDGSGADTYDELDCMDYEANEFDKLPLGLVGIGKYVVTTWEFEALTPESILRFILQEVRNAIDTLDSGMVLYGAGLDHTETEQGGTVTRKRPQYFGIQYQTSNTDQKNVSSIKKIIGETGDYKNVLQFMENAELVLDDVNPDALEGAEFFLSKRAFNQLWNMRDSNGDRMFDIARPITFFGNYNITVDNRLKGLDIIFGNPSNYLVNEGLTVGIYNDKAIRCRLNMYGAFGMRGGSGFPQSFVFGTDATAPRSARTAKVEKFRENINFRGKKANPTF